MSSPNVVQGNAIAALTSAWSLSKILFFFSRYHTVLALGFFLMEAIGTKHFTLPLNVTPQHVAPDSKFYAPCIANLKVGLVTTILSILGGSSALLGSTGILTCDPNQANVPDVNISMNRLPSLIGIYLGLIIHKAADSMQIIEAPDGNLKVRKMSILAAVESATMAPTLHVCLRDAALYFVVIFAALLLNLVLISKHDRYAQLGTPWLLATYSVASSRIFLNLKDVALSRNVHLEGAWSQFQPWSALEFQLQSTVQAAREVQSTWRASLEGRPTFPLSQPRRTEDWE
ncbi:hypothetical protein DFH09DRAFT_1332979 [Mycena vulgaris]|nr:hypothetical protein DFH09DRAFT_1332979 [Mycena vulgaris]